MIGIVSSLKENAPALILGKRKHSKIINNKKFCHVLFVFHGLFISFTGGRSKIFWASKENSSSLFFKGDIAGGGILSKG